MKRDKFFPYLLVVVQISCLIFIFVSGPFLSNNTSGLLIECTGVFFTLHSIYVMKIRNFNITPTIKQDSELITSGPYRIIRHPMYIGQLIAVLPLVIDYFSWYRFSAFAILAIILMVKINYEEKLLLAHFTDYRAYMKRTKKLIPYLY